MAPAEGLILLDEDYHCFSIQKELESYPCDMISRMKEKLIEIVEEEEFKFKKTVLNLILGHENVFIKEYSEALKIFEELEMEMETLINVGCSDPLFDKVSSALLNVIKTCKTYVLISQNKYEKAREVIQKVTSSKNLNKQNKASVFGIRSMVFMEYGLYGHKIALENAEKAKKTDPKNPYWHFLYGKALGRIRRVETPYSIPSDKERSALQTAIDMEDNYLFMLFTAENYVETASKTYHFHFKNRSLHPTLKLEIDHLNEEASRLFRKCIEIQPNCSHVLFRAAKGFLNLPYPQKDAERAKELLLKGLENNPRNPYANHLLARYYERYGSNITKSMEYLKICREQNVFGAEMDLLRLEYSKNQDAKYIIDRLHELLDIYREMPRKLQILTQMASYYIFIETNLPKASKLLKEAITMNYDDNISNHRSLFLRVKEPFSILNVLIDEMKIHMEKNCEPDTKKVYESFIMDMNDSRVPILKGRAKNLKDEILQENEALRSTGNFQKKYVGGSNGKPRGTSRRSSFSRNGRNTPQRPAPRPIVQQKIEKARSVQKVDDLFDSYTSEGSKSDAKRDTNAGKNSLHSSYSDLSAASDSRYATSRGRSNNKGRNTNKNPKDSVDGLEFDRLSLQSRNSPQKPATNYSPRKYDNGDRLNGSPRNSDPRLPNGRGRSAYATSRTPTYDKGDFDQGSLGRGRGKKPGSGSAPSQQANEQSKQRVDQTPRSPPWRRQVTSVTKPLEDSDSEEDLMSYFKKK